MSTKIPFDREDNTTSEIIEARRQFVQEVTGVAPRHIVQHSLDPRTTAGNIENFIGVAQVPIGVAGPLVVDGEHARGEFFVPFATIEGTIVASHNRGMKILAQAGGAKVTLAGEAMQRGPVFVFDDARRARDFVAWLAANRAAIAAAAEATTRFGKLADLTPYQVGDAVYLRFDMTTGDAAGQNMVSKAAEAACRWISDHFPGIRDQYLEANLSGDKRASLLNALRTRGRRAIAEVILARDLVVEGLHVVPERLARLMNLSYVAGILSGSSSNSLQIANGVAALFLATGQDVGNVAESSAGITCVELTTAGDLRISLTIPSLIVATYGGGTALATQRECLEMLGCYGAGGAPKLAEIVVATCLAGEISLMSAIASSEWVRSHEALGRNRK